MMQDDFKWPRKTTRGVDLSIRNKVDQKKVDGVKVSSDDLISYVDGSLIKDAERYNQVEEAICNDLDLFNECVELRRKIWLTESDNGVKIESLGRQLELGIPEFKTHKASEELPLIYEPSEVSTEDLIRYVDGSLLAELDRYHHVEEAIRKNNDLYEECVRLRKLIWGA
jgi:hypothetical protein